MSDERTVAVDSLILDSRCQARATSSTEVIEEYRDAYLNEKADPPRKLPALDVFEVDGGLVIVDGYHRQGGLVAAGKTFVRARVVGSGTIGEAIWYASRANATHGLRRSNDDKRRAVWLAFESGIGVEQSNRVIAEHCGVGHPLVADVRREWEASQVEDSSTCAEPAKRRGRDGKRYTAPARKPKAPAARVVSDPEAMHSAGDGFGDGDDFADPHGADVRTWTPEEGAEPATTRPDSMPGYAPALRAAAKAIREARLLARRALPEALTSVRQRVEDGLQSVESALKYAEPVQCPKCSGAGCKACGSKGWTTRQVAGR